MKTHPGSHTWRNFSFFRFLFLMPGLLLINVAGRPLSVNHFRGKYSFKTNKQRKALIRSFQQQLPLKCTAVFSPNISVLIWASAENQNAPI